MSVIFSGALRSEIETLLQGAQEEWANTPGCGDYDALDVAQFAMDGVTQNRAEWDALRQTHGCTALEQAVLAYL